MLHSMTDTNICWQWTVILHCPEKQRSAEHGSLSLCFVTQLTAEQWYSAISERLAANHGARRWAAPLHTCSAEPLADARLSVTPSPPLGPKLPLLLALADKNPHAGSHTGTVWRRTPRTSQLCL